MSLMSMKILMRLKRVRVFTEVTIYCSSGFFIKMYNVVQLKFVTNIDGHEMFNMNKHVVHDIC